MENEIGTDKTINLLKDINAEIEGAGYEADLSEAAKMKKKEYGIPQAPPVSSAPVPPPPPPHHPHPHHTSDETEVPEVDSEQEEPHPPIPSRAPPVPVSVPAPAPAPAAPTSAPAAAPPIQNPMHLLHSKVDTLKRTKRTKNLCLMVILNLQVHHHITNYHKDLNLVVGQQLHLHLHQFLLQLYQTHVHHHHQYQ